MGLINGEDFDFDFKNCKNNLTYIDTIYNQTFTVKNVGGPQTVEIDFKKIAQFSIPNGSIQYSIYHLNKLGSNAVDSSRFIVWEGSLSQSNNGTILSIREVEKDTFGEIFKLNSFVGERQ